MYEDPGVVGDSYVPKALISELPAASVP